jgi:hypothetical protein
VNVKERKEDENYDRDEESGLPLFPAQRCLGLARLSDDVGEVYSEILVLPNVAFFFYPVNGMLMGESLMTSPQYARQFVGNGLAQRCKDITECDCQDHDGKTLELLDPETEFAR